METLIYVDEHGNNWLPNHSILGPTGYLDSCGGGHAIHFLRDSNDGLELLELPDRHHVAGIFSSLWQWGNDNTWMSKKRLPVAFTGAPDELLIEYHCWGNMLPAEWSGRMAVWHDGKRAPRCAASPPVPLTVKSAENAMHKGARGVFRPRVEEVKFPGGRDEQISFRIDVANIVDIDQRDVLLDFYGLSDDQFSGSLTTRVEYDVCHSDDPKVRKSRQRDHDWSTACNLLCIPTQQDSHTITVTLRAGSDFGADLTGFGVRAWACTSLTTARIMGTRDGIRTREQADRG